MKRVKWKGTGAAMTAMAITIGSVCRGGPCDALAAGFTRAEDRAIVTTTITAGTFVANNPSHRFGELGALGNVFTNATKKPNSFCAGPETMPNLLTVLILAAGLLFITLMPRPYQWKRQKERETKLSTIASSRKAKRQTCRQTPSRSIKLDSSLSTARLTMR